MGSVLIGATVVVFMNLVVDIGVLLHRPPSEALVTATANAIATQSAEATSVGDVVLDVNDLSVVFPTEEGLVKAVSNLSYQARLGRTLAIVGESGSGKSVSQHGGARTAQPEAHADHRAASSSTASSSSGRRSRRSRRSAAPRPRWSSRTRRARCTRSTRSASRSPRPTWRTTR